GELRLRELLGERVERVREQEARRDRDVRLRANRRVQVRNVVRGRVRLKRGDLDLQLLLGLLQALELRLVEGSVVELADVADERGPERRLARFGRCLAGAAPNQGREPCQQDHDQGRTKYRYPP